MTHYCTYFDRNYLVRGLALYRSMVAHCRPFLLHVLCLDDNTHARLTAAALPGVHPIRLADLERADPALPAVKSTRSRVEYYFTLTPALVLHILTTHPAAGAVTYIDADFYFFARPVPFAEALAAHPVVIVGHRFPPYLQHLARFGTYNVGILGFRDDPVGRACLGWWRARCLEWCYDRLEDGKFADQKYLDDWPERFPGVHVLPHKGVNLAPWNVGGYRVAREKGRVTVDGEDLICYHFHRLRVVTRYTFQLGVRVYETHPTPAVRRHIYGPYIRELQTLIREAGRPGAGGVRYRRGWAAEILRLIDGGPLVVAVGRGMVSL